VRPVEGTIPEEFVELYVPRQRLHFYDGSYLEFSLTVTTYPELEVTRYRFRYADPDGEYWRLEKHPGHEKEDGDLTHIHRLGERSAQEEVDFGDVLDRIRSERTP
jgi:hypothetical protein